MAPSGLHDGCDAPPLARSAGVPPASARTFSTPASTYASSPETTYTVAEAASPVGVVAVTVATPSPEAVTTPAAVTVATPAGTRFTYSLTLRPAGALRGLEPLLKWMLARQVRSDVRRLQQRLQAGPQRGHEFAAFGLMVDRSGLMTVTVREVPALLAAGDIAGLLRDVLADAMESGASRRLEDRQHDLLVTQACLRGSVVRLQQRVHRGVLVIQEIATGSDRIDNVKRQVEII